MSAVRAFRGPALSQIAFPLGGIGTGPVSLGGRGNLQDWELFNRPGKGNTLARTFLAIRAHPQGGAPAARVLERNVSALHRRPRLQEPCSCRACRAFAKRRLRALIHLRASASRTTPFPPAFRSKRSARSFRWMSPRVRSGRDPELSRPQSRACAAFSVVARGDAQSGGPAAARNTAASPGASQIRAHSLPWRRRRRELPTRKRLVFVASASRHRVLPKTIYARARPR